MSKHQSIGSVCPSRTQQNEELELQYKTCYARILDSKRRFLVRCQCCSMLTQRNTAGLVVWHSRVAELQAPLPGGLPRLSRMGCGSASFTSLLWQCTHAMWLAALHASARPLNMQEAATRYYELSQVGKRKIGDHEVCGNMTAFGARSELWRGAGTCNVNKGLDTVYPCSDQQALPSAPSLSVDLGGRPGAGAAVIHQVRGAGGGGAAALAHAGHAVQGKLGAAVYECSFASVLVAAAAGCNLYQTSLGWLVTLSQSKHGTGPCYHPA